MKTMMAAMVCRHAKLAAHLYEGLPVRREAPTAFSLSGMVYAGVLLLLGVGWHMPAGGARGVRIALWMLAAALGAWQGVRIRADGGNGRWRGYLAMLSLVLVVSLLGYTKAGARSNWDKAVWQGDTPEYVNPEVRKTYCRPFVYPLFVDVIRSAGAFARTGRFAPPAAITPPDGAAHVPALLLVSRAQQLLVFGAMAGLAWALAVTLREPLAFALLLGLYDRGFIFHLDSILSESLALAWLLILVAMLFSVIRSRRLSSLVAAGAVFGLLVQTRTSGVFAGILMAAMLLWALIHDAVGQRRAVVGCILAATVILAAGVVNLYRNTGVVSLSGKDGLQLVGKALPLAERADLDLFDDPTQREFLSMALTRRDLALSELVHDNKGDGRLVRKQEGTVMMYGVALPLLAQLQPGLSFAQQAAWLRGIGVPILSRHVKEYALRSCWYLNDAMSTGGALAAVAPGAAWAVTVLVLGAAMWIRGWSGYVAAALGLTHLAHMILIAFLETSAKRYVRLSEWMLIVAVFALAIGVREMRASKLERSAVP